MAASISAAPYPTPLSKQKVLDIVGQYGSPAIIDTMTLDGGQQVNLEVRILEARRDAGRELGIAWGGSAGPVNVNVNNTTECRLRSRPS